MAKYTFVFTAKKNAHETRVWTYTATRKEDMREWLRSFLASADGKDDFDDGFDADFWEKQMNGPKGGE